MMNMNTLTAIYTSNEPVLINADFLQENTLKIDKSSVFNETIQSNNYIQSQPLHCFYSQYIALGGINLPKDIVNMVIQQVDTVSALKHAENKQFAIFRNITKQISILQIKSTRDIWRLSTVITEREYGFKVSFIKWYLFG